MATVSHSTSAARNYLAGKGGSPFGGLLREWRSARGLSQLDLAQELRIECFIPADDASEATVARLEADAR